VTYEVQPAEPAVNNKPKRWFSFSVRELMLVTTVVSLALALLFVKAPQLKPPKERFQLMSQKNEEPLVFDNATGHTYVRSPERDDMHTLPTSSAPAANPPKP
jgi:hypothetical protein